MIVKYFPKELRFQPHHEVSALKYVFLKWKYEFPDFRCQDFEFQMKSSKLHLKSRIFGSRMM